MTLSLTRSLRGKLLSFACYVYPASIDELSILGVFHEYHRHEEILKGIEYLVDGGYLDRDEVPHPYRPAEKVRMYKATPRGIDVQDGAEDAPQGIALEVPR